MADQQITDLPVATEANDEDLLLMRQGSTDKSVTKEILFDNALKADENLNDLPNKATARTNLDVPQTNTVLLKANNLSDIPNSVTARQNLDLEIGVDVQAYSAQLAAVSANNTTVGFVAQTGTNTQSNRTLNQPAAGLTIANSTGSGGNPTFALANDLAALEALASTGFAARTNTDTWAQRTLTQPAAGLTITNPAGIAGDPTFALANDLSALEALSSTGFAARTGSDAWAQRSLQQPAAGLTITNPAGIAGDPTFALANDLAALEAMSSTGIVTRTASETYAQRTITGTANQVDVANGSGVSGNPTLTIPTDFIVPATSSSPSSLTLKEQTTNGTNFFKLKAPADVEDDITLLTPPDSNRIGTGSSRAGNYYGLAIPAPASSGDPLQLELVPVKRVTLNNVYLSIGTASKDVQFTSAYGLTNEVTIGTLDASTNTVLTMRFMDNDGVVRTDMTFHYQGFYMIGGVQTAVSSDVATSMPLTAGLTAKFAAGFGFACKISYKGGYIFESFFARSSDSARVYSKVMLMKADGAGQINSGIQITAGSGTLSTLGLLVEALPYNTPPYFVT